MANNEALRFPDWEAALSKVSEGREQIVFKRAILGFLHHCKVSRAPATVMLAKEYIEQLEKQGNKREESTREALRWFVKTARSRGVQESVYQGTPPSLSVSKKQKPEGDVRLVENGAQQSGSTTQKPAEMAGKSTSVFRAGHAPLAAGDLGGADWERDLIKAIRERGFLWRTERTYREWAARFAQFLKPRLPYAATKEDLGGF